MTIHVRTWPGSGSFRITDMTGAGKRGRKCRVLRFSGTCADAWVAKGDALAEVAAKASREALDLAGRLDGETPFDDARAAVLGIISRARAAGVSEYLVAVYDEDIRAIDAPRPKLTASVEGVWSASAEEEGIPMEDLADRWNEWREITFGQTAARAYAIAARVWEKVQAAATLHEARGILLAAGAKLHGYCGMD